MSGIIHLHPKSCCSQSSLTGLGLIMSKLDDNVNINENERPEEKLLESEMAENSCPMVTGTVDSNDDMYEDSGTDEEGNEGLKAEDNSATVNAENTNGGPEGLVGYKSRRVLLNQIPASSSGPLPEGWIKAIHSSGFPLYFHKTSRVITWSRPYTLLTGRVHKHDIPMESIPCLHLKKRSLDSESSGRSESSKIDQSNQEDKISVEDGEISDSPTHPKVTIDNAEPHYIDDEEFVAYLEKRFQFDTRQIPQFQKWSQRREYNKNLKRKRMDESNNTTKESENLDEVKGSAANLITLTVEQEDGGSTTKKKFVLNTSSKPMICILHEYAQRVLKTQPQYTFQIREDSAEPFEAVIKLQDKVYGTAYAINKKTAKNKAALATLEMLIPGFKGQVESNHGHPDMKCFNDVSVSDPRVHELCTHTGQLLPYQLLTECLKRHQGVSNTEVSYDVQQGKRRTLNYTMMCGKYIVSGVSKNKKLGKQLAAQKMLQQIHPEVETWIELIDKYGTPMAHERAKRRKEEQEIFDLKQKKSYEYEEDVSSSSNTPERPMNEPNPELLAKLREMMLNLKEQQEKRQAKEILDAQSGKIHPTPMAAAIAANRGLITTSEANGGLAPPGEDRKPSDDV